MLYYRAKRDAYDYFNKNGVVENELLTEKERTTKVRYISDDVFTPVTISRKKTFFNFGVRLEMKGE